MAVLAGSLFATRPGAPPLASRLGALALPVAALAAVALAIALGVSGVLGDGTYATPAAASAAATALLGLSALETTGAPGLRRLAFLLALLAARPFTDLPSRLRTAGTAPLACYDRAVARAARREDAMSEDIPEFPTLNVHGGAIDGYEMKLSPGMTVIIGSGRLAQMRLDHPDIELAHVKVAWDDQGISMIDNGSRKGTWVNGEPVETVSLLDGDVIEFVGAGQQVDPAEGEDPHPEGAVPEPPPPPPPTPEELAARSAPAPARAAAARAGAPRAAAARGRACRICASSASRRGRSCSSPAARGSRSGSSSPPPRSTRSRPRRRSPGRR